ncbi:hypothetical protein QFZ70_003556 [Arthrobacter sp. V1I9]|uniref:hypothetical protein n=1 Tax=Arthrobacter sp. V1I9 TaxID=3042275 RepID=UPI002791C810|nr:hypothetical protein [Arthrobacter sp. V1I9]MDQ0871083.1 hypothetical protein [Arthrobacter sp. V1I9]
MTPRASFRLFRTGLIGSVVLGLAFGGHLAGGGQVPALSVLAALCGVTMIPIAALTRARLSFPVLTGLVGAGQLWLHWGLEALSVGAPPPVTLALLAGHADHTGRGGHAGAHSVQEAVAVVGAAPTHAAAPDWLMFASHTVATVFTALLLARGERALAVLAGWLEPLLRQREPALILPARTPVLGIGTVVLPSSRPGIRLPSRRGPPVLAPAA